MPRGELLMDRFIDKLLVMPDRCWHWTAARHSFGYGKIGLGPKSQGNTVAHRVAYELFVGPIPEGKFVCHTCDVPQCVNPSHLYLGTHQDNVDDMVRKGRNYVHPRKTHCCHGHALVGDNVYMTNRGAQSCRHCNREAVRRYRTRNAEALSEADRKEYNR